jgi:hypothetical protein
MWFCQRPLMSPVVLQILSRVNQSEMIGGHDEPLTIRFHYPTIRTLSGKCAGVAPIFFRWTQHL